MISECPIFEFKDNLPFVSLFPLVFYYDGLKPHKVHRNIDFPFKMVHFCTKTPNFNSEYLKNAQTIAKILKVLTKFIKKVYKNINILLKDAYADKICSKCTSVQWRDRALTMGHALLKKAILVGK